MRMTKQKLTILQYFQEHRDDHPTAEEVYDYVKKLEPTIGIATVYRNLNRLVELNKVRELNLKKQGVHYDLIAHEHDHFICSTCGKIENFVLPSLSTIDKEVEKLLHVNITNKNLLCYGTCQECIASSSQNE